MSPARAGDGAKCRPKRCHESGDSTSRGLWGSMKFAELRNKGTGIQLHLFSPGMSQSSVMALGRVPTRSNGGWPKGRWNPAQQTLKSTQWWILGAVNGRPTAVNEGSTAAVGFVAHTTRRQRPSNGDAVGTPVSKFATQ
jgi:hypothetical protein